MSTKGLMNRLVDLIAKIRQMRHIHHYSSNTLLYNARIHFPNNDIYIIANCMGIKKVGFLLSQRSFLVPPKCRLSVWHAHCDAIRGPASWKEKKAEEANMNFLLDYTNSPQQCNYYTGTKSEGRKRGRERE